MQIVIDIDEEDFEIMKHNITVDNPLCPLSEKEMVSKVANGTPLPKGHGRLIDETEADRLIAKGKDGDKTYFGTVNKDWEVVDFLMTVPTIIKADKRNEDEE